MSSSIFLLWPGIFSRPRIQKTPNAINFDHLDEYSDWLDMVLTEASEDDTVEQFISIIAQNTILEISSINSGLSQRATSI